jgi:hypothetical protein
MNWHHTYFQLYTERGNKALNYEIVRYMHYTVYRVSQKFGAILQERTEGSL